MKKLLFWLLAIVPFFASGQDIKITGAVSKTEFQAFKDSLKLALGGVVVTPPVEPCKRGPEIKEISEITNTSAKILFDGEKVEHLSVEIFN